MRILVTGGAGFIGSTLVRNLIADSDHEVLNVDALTYAGTLSSLAAVDRDPRYRFVRADIRDAVAIRRVLEEFRPGIVVHLAAESHVDRSINAPAVFVETNVVGTLTMLQESLRHWRGLDQAARRGFRFHHVSTDEVFGSLGATGAFDEASAYDPRSPYAASKAGADHLVRAWHHTYGLPTLVSNSSNNYGPFQFPEKLIPLTIVRALAGEEVRVYGDGTNVRDWLHVEDHARALRAVFERGTPGETYAIGGRCERSNMEVVGAICAILDRSHPRRDGLHADLIRLVDDRPGHDRRYAIDASKIVAELGWSPDQGFEEGLERTVGWYGAHRPWWQHILARQSAVDRAGALSI